MSNLIIENRKLYLEILSNHLTPLLYQGFESIYDDADKISNNNNVLKNFQIFLKKIPQWSMEILEKENMRILANLTDSDYIINLIKLIIKYTLLQLTLHKNNLLLSDDNLYNEIDFKTILHNIYIESAREIYLNPFLFYNKLPSVEIKKNQNIVLNIISKKIEKIIMELLPLDEIVMRNLQIPLTDYQEKPILEKPIIEEPIIDKPIIEEPKMEFKPQWGGFDVSENKIEIPKKEYSEKFISASKLPDNQTSTQDEILNIIKQAKEPHKPLKLSDISETLEEPKEKVINVGGGKDNSSDGLKKIMNELKNSNVSETSVSFVPPSEDFDEVFTNKKEKKNESPTKKLNKNKYFTNYLKV